MPKIKPELLEEIIKNSGISAATANKLRAANGEDKPAEAPKGHGAPRPKPSALPRL